METSQKHNFGAGPCILPKSVMEQAASAVVNWNNDGLSILEVSHRSPQFESVVLKTQLLVRELLKVPDDYAVLFLQGGASTQFSMIPLNFLKTCGIYLDTGYFAQKAIKEAGSMGMSIFPHPQQTGLTITSRTGTLMKKMQITSIVLLTIPSKALKYLISPTLKYHLFVTCPRTSSPG